VPTNCAPHARPSLGETLNAVVDSGESVSDVVRRLQFGVRLLNEYNITDKIDESMIESGRRDLSKYTRYLPLIGSFNNLCNAACVVETRIQTQKRSKSSSSRQRRSVWKLSYGPSVLRTRWHGEEHASSPTAHSSGSPGTDAEGVSRSTDERTPLAIRGSVYGEAVTESNVEFVWDQIQNLKTDAEEWNYDANLISPTMRYRT